MECRVAENLGGKGGIPKGPTNTPPNATGANPPGNKKLIAGLFWGGGESGLHKSLFVEAGYFLGGVALRGWAP